VALIVFIWIFIGLAAKEAALKKDLEAKRTKIANLETLKAKITLLRERENRVKQELSLFPSSMLASVPYREMLREVSRIVPENVTLTLLSVRDKGKPMKKEAQTPKPEGGESSRDEGRELHITGMAFGSDANCLTALAKIIEGLERSPLFKNVKLASAEENKLFNQSAARFEMVCDVLEDGKIKKEEP
jgi:Tfp pilus assembly protein PilN